MPQRGTACASLENQGRRFNNAGHAAPESNVKIARAVLSQLPDRANPYRLMGGDRTVNQGSGIKYKAEEVVSHTLTAYRLILAAALAVQSSWAMAFTGCSGTQGTTLTIALPTSVTLTRDVGGVTALSEWIDIDTPPVTHSTCTMGNAAAWFSDSFRWYNTLQDSGKKYDGFTVYKTALEGIGVAIQT